MSKTIVASDLNRVDPVYNGLDLFWQAISSKESVFCVCTAARDFHVGWKDALEVLTRASHRDGTHVIKKTDDNEEETLFIPKDIKNHRRFTLTAQENYIKKTLDDVYLLFHSFNPHYVRGMRLSDLPGGPHRRFIFGFQKLRHTGILPSTTGDSVFNHQGMMLLMRRCFPTDDMLLNYIADPHSLRVEATESDDLDQISESIFRLAAKKRAATEAIILDGWLGYKILTAISELEVPTRKDILKKLSYPNTEMPRLNDAIDRLESVGFSRQRRGSHFATNNGRDVVEKIQHYVDNWPDKTDMIGGEERDVDGQSQPATTFSAG